ncbi:unnamed protein product, partial [Owenia fusiformis]
EMAALPLLFLLYQGLGLIKVSSAGTQAVSQECQRLPCGGDNAVAKVIQCPKYHEIQILRVKNIAERTCDGIKICETQIRYPHNIKRKCNNRNRCLFASLTLENEGERCKTFDEDGRIIWHKTTTQEVCYNCHPLPTTTPGFISPTKVDNQYLNDDDCSYGDFLLVRHNDHTNDRDI